MLLAFLLGVVLFSVWELRGGPRWRAPVVLLSCAALALTFMSLRFV
jgi:hypothetical protein